MTGYVNPGVLVVTAWVADHSADNGVRGVECDEDKALYEARHIPGAVKVDWHTDLNGQRVREYVNARAFGRLAGRLGIVNDSAVVFYGDQANWWAAYAYWVFRMFGHGRLHLMNGGRNRWLAERRPLTKDRPVFPDALYVVRQMHPEIRALRAEVLHNIGSPNLRHLVVQLPAGNSLVDVRTPAESSGELLHMAGHPQEGTLRGGHIPGAVNVPWGRGLANDETSKSADEIRRLYEGQGITPDRDIIVYDRIGERSSLTLFVLHELLGCRRVRNYDGSWTEWENSVGVPIANPSLVGSQIFHKADEADSRAALH